jgi:tRNA threonylcarbamoyladenosine biosynthesis protein TsaB
MLNLLALDTSTERAALGLLRRDGTVLCAASGPERRHGRDLIPRLAELLSRGEVKPADLDGIGVGLGPGSYTGLRVGVMAAKTLAYTTGAPIIGLDSLEAVARQSRGALHIWVVADAQRGEVYTAEFTRTAPGDPLKTARGTAIENLTDWSARLDSSMLVLGPGLGNAQIRAAIPAGLLTDDPAHNYPEGSALMELARDVWMSGQRDDPWLLEPRYLRRSAAEEKWESRNPERPV